MFNFTRDFTPEEEHWLRTAPLGYFKNFRINLLISTLEKNGHLAKKEAEKLLAMN
jgi:hypothetical protein